MRGRSAVRLSVALVTAGACRAPETVWLPTPPPPVAEAQGVVWMIEWADGRIAYTQAEPGATLQFPAVAWVDGPPAVFRVYAAYYLESLSALALPEGRLRPAEAPRPCAVNTPFALFEAEVVDGGPVQWRPSTEWAEDQQTFLSTGAGCQRPTRCRPFQADIEPLGSNSSALSMIRLSADELLVLQEDQRVSTVDLDGPDLQDQLTPPATAMALRPDGLLFFGGRRGQVAEGPLTGPLITSTITETARRVVALAAAENDSGEVFALSTTGEPPTAALHRFDGSAWTEFWRDTVDATKVSQSRLLWLPTGQLLAIYGGASVLIVEGETVDRVEVGRTVLGPVELGSLLIGADEAGRNVAYIGGADASLYQAALTDLRNWRAVGGAPFITGIRGLGVIPGGLLLGTAGGSVQAFFPGEGFCPAQTIAGSDVQLIDAIGDVIVVTGGSIVPENPASVTYLR